MGSIAIDLLYPDPINPRDDLGDIEALAASIAAQGMLQPIVVRKRAAGGWFVVDGHRRLEAALRIGLDAVPALASRAAKRDDVLTVMLAAAMHKALSPIEQASAFAKLTAGGMTRAEIARRTGYSTETVAGRLLLAELPEDAQQMVEDKTITVAEGVSLARAVKATGTGTATHQTAKTAWLTASHALAPKVATRCDHRESRRLVGGSGCGQCWEAAIREDERERTPR